MSEIKIEIIHKSLAQSVAKIDFIAQIRDRQSREAPILHIKSPQLPQPLVQIQEMFHSPPDLSTMGPTLLGLRSPTGVTVEEVVQSTASLVACGLRNHIVQVSSGSFRISLQQTNKSLGVFSICCGIVKNKCDFRVIKLYAPQSKPCSLVDLQETCIDSAHVRKEKNTS